MLRVLAAEHAGIHLALEERHGLVEHRPQHCGQIDAQMDASIESLATHQAHIVRVVGKQVEAGADDQLHLPLTGLRRGHGRGETFEPVAQQVFEDFPVQHIL